MKLHWVSIDKVAQVDTVVQKLSRFWVDSTDRKRDFSKFSIKASNSQQMHYKAVFLTVTLIQCIYLCFAMEAYSAFHTAAYHKILPLSPTVGRTIIEYDSAYTYWYEGNISKLKELLESPDDPHTVDEVFFIKDKQTANCPGCKANLNVDNGTVALHWYTQSFYNIHAGPPRDDTSILLRYLQYII